MRRIEPYSPLPHRTPRVDDRRIVTGIIVVIKNGVRWRDAPMHPQTHANIERSHQTLKNRVLMENYFPPGDVERQIDALVKHYNRKRYYESLTT